MREGGGNYGPVGWVKDEGNYILEQKGGAEGREGVGVVSKGGGGWLLVIIVWESYE